MRGRRLLLVSLVKEDVRLLVENIRAVHPSNAGVVAQVPLVVARVRRCAVEAGDRVVLVVLSRVVLGGRRRFPGEGVVVAAADADARVGHHRVEPVRGPGFLGILGHVTAQGESLGEVHGGVDLPAVVVETLQVDHEDGGSLVDGEALRRRAQIFAPLAPVRVLTLEPLLLGEVLQRRLHAPARAPGTPQVPRPVAAAVARSILAARQLERHVQKRVVRFALVPAPRAPDQVPKLPLEDSLHRRRRCEPRARLRVEHHGRLAPVPAPARRRPAAVGQARVVHRLQRQAQELVRVLLPAPHEVPREQAEVAEDLLGRDGLVVRRVPRAASVSAVSPAVVQSRASAKPTPLGSGRERGAHVPLDDAEGARLARVRESAVGGVTAGEAELGERRRVGQRLEDGVEEARVAEVAEPAADGRDVVADGPAKIDGLERGERGIARPRAHRIARRRSRRGRRRRRRRSRVASADPRALGVITGLGGRRRLLPRRETRRVACRGRRG